VDLLEDWALTIDRLRMESWGSRMSDIETREKGSAFGKAILDLLTSSEARSSGDRAIQS
jgi:hypothetical protein